ncbi:MAG: DUF1549 domain-containing protein [Acidobacteria bacterium]|nr:DUF1549 domain-containing protein [Acidobacteriota bacterium]
MATRLRIAAFVAAVAAAAWLSAAALAGGEERAETSSAQVADCTYYVGHERLYVANPTAQRDRIAYQLKQFSSNLPGTGSFYAPAPRNFIDDHIFDKMARNNVSSANLSTDPEFLRRAYLDATGRLPSAETVVTFLDDASPGKRDRLIDSLLETPEYADRWSNFIGDMLGLVIRSTQINLYPDARNAYYDFVRDSIGQNKPYDLFVRELISGSGNNRENGAADFFVRWRQSNGPIQDTYDNLAAAVGSQFLGLTLNCISCHDGGGHTNAINLYLTELTRYDLWEIAAFFSKTAMTNPYRDPNYNNNITGYTVADNARLPGYVLNTTTGNKTPRQGNSRNEIVAPGYIADGGASDDQGPGLGEGYRDALARLVTSDRQFARATVNYIWRELFGMGIVEPADNFDLRRINPQAKLPQGWAVQPTHPALLEALAEDFERNGYDLKHLIATIMKSSTYQLSSTYPGKWSDAYIPYFARKFPRRLKAEEMHDVIVQATGVPPAAPYAVSGYAAPVNWAMQLPDPMEPGGRGESAAQRTAGAQARTFLDTFLRGNRDDEPRSSQGSISQVLLLLNNRFVTDRVKASNASSTVARLFANKNLGASGMINQLYLSTLSRMPSGEEFQKSLAYLGNPVSSQKLEDLQFTLLNKVDFIFNY